MWSFSHETIFEWLRNGCNKKFKACIFLCVDDLECWNIGSLRNFHFRKQNKSCGNLLYFSIKYKNQELFYKLLTKYYEYNKRLDEICYINGDTILHSAAKYNTMHYLYRHYLYQPFLCFVNNKNNDGETPLHVACNFKNKEAIELLLGIFPNFNIMENDPLQYCITNLNYDIVKFLLQQYSYSLSETKFQSYLRSTTCKKMITLLNSYY